MSEPFPLLSAQSVEQRLNMPPEERTEESKKYVREPLTPAKQKRLDAMLEHAQQKITGDKPDFKPDHDYATDLLTQCVLGNPSNIFYVKAYIENLQKKYNNNKTGKTLAKFQELGSRMAQKKAIDQENWDEAIKQGLKVLTVNPWDKTALMNMAKASSKYPGDFEVELYYLKTALLAESQGSRRQQTLRNRLGGHRRYRSGHYLLASRGTRQPPRRAEDAKQQYRRFEHAAA